jgi:hypothetical protein
MSVSSTPSTPAISIGFTASGSVPGENMPGMILAPQQRFSVGEQLRRILRLRTAMTAANMRNQVEFLGSWVERALVVASGNVG